MRKLVTIRTIKELKPIKGADLIETAVVDGWSVVVKKVEFKVGEQIIFFEIDSFIPHSLAPYLSRGREPSEYLGVKGERLRTIKLKGQISQGLILKLTDDVPTHKDFDLDKYFGVVKYEPPNTLSTSGMPKGAFPSLIPKTDIERYQNINIDDYKDHKFFVTEKLEGCSATYALLNGEFIVCSKNVNLKEDETSVYWEIARKYKIEETLRSINLNIAIQGEIVGGKIQGNYYNLPDIRFYAFSVFMIDQNRYTHEYDDFLFLETISINSRNGENYIKSIPPLLNYVPTLAFAKLSEWVGISDDFDGLTSKLNKEKIIEGVVLQSYTDPNIRIKVINKKYLLQEK